MEQETDRLLTSIAIVLVVAAAAGLVGAVLPSRVFGFVGGLVAVTTVALLVVAEYRFLDRETGEFTGDVLGAGLWCSAAGAIVLLLSSLALRVDVQSELVRT
jgi:cobalamin synthase